jgi:uncharacterized protein YajQ (UPF0234 family)
MQEVSNAVSNSMKEISQRYDFKGSNSKIDLKEKNIVLETEDELKAKQVNEILLGHFVKRNIDPTVLKLKNSEKASGNTIRQTYDLMEGIDQVASKKIISEVKSTKMKVQVKIQGNELRVSGAKRDDLQKTMEIVKNIELEMPVQFVNLRD